MRSNPADPAAAKHRILLVYVRGGPALEYTIPRIAARGEVHLLAVWPLPEHTAELWRGHCASVIGAWDQNPEGEALVELIVKHAKEVRADAIVTVAEYAILTVSEAAQRLGLRSSGPNTILSRDKRRMREAWHQAGVPCPRFRPVASSADLAAAYQELTPPVLLKYAWGAASVGQRVISSPEEIGPVWSDVREAVAKALNVGFIELQESGAAGHFLAEEIIQGSTRGWWPDDSGYGDYLSVEGIVADGIYHPLCITSRMPTIEPFTELSNLAPCALPENLQRRIESVARSAVDALGLETCATHTEMKLMEDGGLSLIESAARIGGCMIAAQVEEVFGLDMIGMLTDALLGAEVNFPERMLIYADARGAASSLALIGTDSAGTPWSRELAWEPSLIDWDKIVSPGTRIEAVPGLTISAGTPVPRYDVSGGALGYGGVFYVRCASVETLLPDSYAVLDNLEAALLAATVAREQH